MFAGTIRDATANELQRAIRSQPSGLPQDDFTVLYQPIDRAGDSDLILDQLKARPEWWLRTDSGEVVPFGGQPGGHPMPNYSIPECQDWYASLAISLFPNCSAAANLLDGTFLDGDGYLQHPGVSTARNEAVY